jgi:4-diphosphocytidyl-2-C-methyl-D-erythritol kinase
VSGLPLRVLAPAKVNLGLWVGPLRADGRHELVSVMQSISLADELTLEAGAGQDEASGQDLGSGRDVGSGGYERSGRDEVVCPGVDGENLALRALTAFRAATDWQAPPLRLNIDKRIPVAAGMGGGSADAAAALRLAAHAAPGQLRMAAGDLGLAEGALLLELAGELGADVPAQVQPGRWLATGAGEQLEALPDPVAPFGLLVLPVADGLSTAAVYAELDRLGSVRSHAFLVERRRALHGALDLGMSLHTDPALLHNDLQAAALSLCPEIGEALAAARAAGADAAFLSGSGPTVVGLFPRANGLAAARRAAADLQGREPAPLVAETVGAAFAEVAGPSIGNN